MNKKTSWQNECTLKFKLVTTITVCCWLLGCNQSNQLPLDSNASDATESIIYKISNGKIEIKPRLKYELAISIHVLKSAEDHHRLFIPWAKQMRKNLSEKTFSDATTLIENAHEWQLCSLVQDYDGPDTIEGITAYIEDDNKRIIAKWASNNGHKVANTLRLNPDQFSKWYADFLKRYYEEGFKEQWLSEHKKLVYKDAENIFNELETLDFSAAEFMEDFTGRKFKGNTKIILYPSSFSRPQHAYGFNEEECKVTVYKIGGGKKEVIGSIFHELLHPLIRDWWKANRMKEPISKLAKEKMFKTSWEKKGKNSYPYPNHWLDEIVVHSVSNYMTYKAGFISKRRARQLSSYCDYEKAFCNAIFDKYDNFDNIDDFIFYAITHIKASKEHFKYVKND